jgi:hypothetical protein
VGKGGEVRPRPGRLTFCLESIAAQAIETETANPGESAGVGKRTSQTIAAASGPFQKALLQLAVFMQHCPAAAAYAPALRGESRAAAQQVVPSHPAGTAAVSRGGWPARRQFGKINRVGGRGRNTNKKTCGYQ